MAYTTIDKSSLHFNTKLYTGTGSSNAITGINFQPDLLWIKSRSNTYSHSWTDAVRGKDNKISSNNTNAQYTDSGQLASFDSDGFTLNTDAGVNNNGSTFASWNWKANGQGSSNTDGSITTTVSANTTAGFSIVKWTAGSGVSGIGHGLGVVPKLIICKDLSVSSAWTVGSDLLNDWGGYLNLSSTNALNSETRMYKPSGYSSPTASLFYQDHSAFGSAGENMIAYCFAEKKGFSKFGTYTGNGNADGTFVFLGFKPAFVLFKNYQSNGDNWVIQDNKREGFNPNNRRLYPNDNAVENTSSFRIDMLSNGFKLRSSDSDANASETFFYMAFAEAPLVGSNNVPCTAR